MFQLLAKQRRVTLSYLGFLALAGASLGCTPTKALAPTSPSSRSQNNQSSQKNDPLSSARRALQKGHFQEAEGFLQKGQAAGDSACRVELAKLFLLTGRYEEVDALLANSASEAAPVLRAQALVSLGQLLEATSLLTSPEDPRVSPLTQLERTLQLGRILVEQGKRPEAREHLVSLVQRVDGGAFSSAKEREQARAWALAGEAAYLLRYFEDANDAFDEAEQLAAPDLELLLLRGRLFLEKHDLSHAGEVLGEAQKLAPHHPEVLLFTARFQLESSMSFDEAQTLCNQVLKVNPRSTKARAILAEIELRDLNFKETQRHLEQGFGVNPRDLHLLALQAAAQFLAEDPVAFEQTVEKVQGLSPGSTELFTVVGDFAEWEHRYPDIEILMRRATRLDPEDAQARALLGLTLVRAGSDAAGVVELKRSFDLDPFNLRVFNTLDLYETIIPRDYETIEKGPFRYRFPKQEARLLERYVPALLESAFTQMEARYAYTPTAPIDIELYSTPEQFAVRTSGLPRTAIQGVCFGRKLATVSPAGSPGNLGMTLWHELGHVFHIGLSKNRVPRWYTEGLAEWETAHRDLGWSRELDLSLLQAKNADALPRLAHMSQAFTHAKTHEDVATAYYLSSKIVDFIIETRGEETAALLLKSLGDKRLPEDVFPEVLGAPFAELDQQLSSWLSTNLTRYSGQFVSQRSTVASKTVEPQVKKSPGDAKLALTLGLSLLSEGDLKAADQQLTKIRSTWPLTKPGVAASDVGAQATFALARLRLAQEDKKAAQAFVEEILKAGYDGFELRMVLARTLLAQKMVKEAEVHLVAASQLDEWDSTPWGLLAALRHAAGDEVGELEAIARLARIEENDAAVHHRLVELLLAQKKFIEAARAADLLLWVDLGHLETHRLAALAFSQAGQLGRANFEWTSALLTQAAPAEKQKLQLSWEGELKRLGRDREAALVADKIATMSSLSDSEP